MEKDKDMPLIHLLFELKRMGHSMLLPEGVHPGAFFLLKTIDKRTRGENNPQGVRVSALCQSMGCSMPGASQMISNLEKRGWVERISDQEDRRVVYVSMTVAGTEFLRAAQNRVVRFSQRLEKAYGVEETKALTEQLQRFIQIAEIEMAKDRGGA